MKKPAEICRKASRVKTGVRRSLAIFGVLVVAMLPAGQVYAQTIDPCIFDALRKDTVWFVGCGSSNCSTPLNPAAGGGSSTVGLVWPFATKSESQYNRVDQGWDLQSTPGAAVYAIAPGTIHVFAPNPGGFGNDYPTEELDASIGGPTSWVYYGHVHVLPSVVSKHVNAGDQIALTNTVDGQNGSAAPPGWLEIGFAQPGTDAPVDSTPIEGPATQAGQTMKNLLLGAQPRSGGSSTSAGSGSSASVSLPSCCGSGGSFTLVGADNETRIWNYLTQVVGLTPIAAAGMMGNFQTETENTWDPRINNGGAKSDFPLGGLAYGIAQWLGGRQDALVQRAHAASVIAGDLALQLNFVKDELNGDYKSNTKDPIQAATSPEQAAQIVFSYYEAPGDNSLQARQQNAHDIYSKYIGSNGGGSPASCTTCATSGSSVSSTAAILCEAQKYNGIYYLKGGGHDYTAFRQSCPESAIATAAVSSTPNNPGPCATDCSGLVAVAVDAVYNKTYSWTIDASGVMVGSGADLWKPIPIDQAQPGDIVTKPDHVDIVDHVQGSTVYTFGSHAPGVKTGPSTTDKSYWTGAFHWSG